MEVSKHGVTLRAASQFLWVSGAGQGVGASPLSMQTEETLSPPAMSHSLVLPSGHSARQALPASERPHTHSAEIT